MKNNQKTQFSTGTSPTVGNLLTPKQGLLRRRPRAVEAQWEMSTALSRAQLQLIVGLLLEGRSQIFYNRGGETELICALSGQLFGWIDGGVARGDYYRGVALAFWDGVECNQYIVNFSTGPTHARW